MVLELTLTVGAVFTVTTPVAGILGHDPEVYVTLYEVVAFGLTEIDWVVAPPGDHKYVPPATEGEAVNVAVCPLQIVALFTLTLGLEITVTRTWSLAVQPFAVAVSVYVVVAVGVAVGVAIVVLLKVAPGDHNILAGIGPGHPAIETDAVCPPVMMATPPLIEVVPHKILYTATFEFDTHCVSIANVYGGFDG